MSSTELATYTDYQTAIAALDKQEGVLPAPTTSGSEKKFFPYLRLFNAKSKEVEVDEKIAANHYGIIVAGDIEADLGKSFEAVFVSARSHAQRFEDGQFKELHFDPTSEAFKAIQELEKEEKDFHWQDQTCKTGPEALLWISTEDVLCFATWFLGWNKVHQYLWDTRLDGWAKQKPIQPKQLTVFGDVNNTMRDGKKSSYYVPKLKPSRAEITPFDVQQGIEAVTQFRTEKPFVAVESTEDEDR